MKRVVLLSSAQQFVMQLQNNEGNIGQREARFLGVYF